MTQTPEPDINQSAQPVEPQTEEALSQSGEWSIISIEKGVTVSVLETERLVTRVRLDWSAQSELEPEEGTEDYAKEVLSNWNTVPGRQFQLD